MNKTYFKKSNTGAFCILYAYEIIYYASWAKNMKNRRFPIFFAKDNSVANIGDKHTNKGPYQDSKPWPHGS